MQLIDNNGAPSGRKHFVFYNPPIVNKPLNIRKSATLEVRDLAGEFLKNKIQTIVFATQSSTGRNYFNVLTRTSEE